MNQTITITFNPEQVITWILIGLIAGVLASLLLRGRRFGFITSVVVGLIGAVIGGALFQVFGINIAGALTLPYRDIVAAIVGALIVLAILFVVFRR
jgi:uncharacterized membrane protein YeaQ/YmgE (transglycosylase-associated protein family)